VVSIESIPLVMAGPIVRRVDDRLACVWLALRESAEVELTVYEVTANGPGAVVMSGRQATIQVAPNLHVVAVSARPLHQPLRWGATYHYDLRFHGGGAPWRLDDPGVLGFSGDARQRLAPLLFANQQLPSFVLPAAKREGLRLAHGSCRKPHGGGRDALALLGPIIDRAITAGLTGATAGAERPQQLFLTGDQIYADDVADALAPEVFALADWLGGGTDLERAELVRPRGPAALAPGGRSPFMKSVAHFTSNSDRSHLVTYLEMCAMYLLVWSDTFWTTALRNAAQLTGFSPHLPAVRKVLANLATYMMFDDHDVTDDWNRTGGWVTSVAESSYGARIVRNALCAYAVFQHWGNDPVAFEGTGPGATFLTTIAGWDGNDEGTAERLAATVQVPEDAPRRLDPARALRWDWSYASPIHVVVALDCRTGRVYDDARAAPGLMSADAIERALAAVPGNERPTIVISGTPILGVGLLAWGQKILAATIKSEDVMDVEAWEFNQVAFDAVIEAMAKRQRVVVLSGDVHYGFGASFVGRESPYQGARIVNFTSSALLNSDHGATLSYLLTGFGDSALESLSRGSSREAPAADPKLAAAAEFERGPVATTREVTVAGGEFKEEILGGEGEPADTTVLESVAGSRRRAAVTFFANVGAISFEPDHVVQTLWAWKDGASEPIKLQHRATLPAH
jgi:hypothetical protein